MATLNEKVNYLTLGEFMALPPAPCQRDIERHALKASTRHLRQPHPRNAAVATASLDVNGRTVTYKIDGHTRAYLWQRWMDSDGKEGLQPISDLLRVEAYDCADLDDLIRLYRTFDVASAAEDAPDLTTGAFRLAGFHPKSRLVASGKVSTAARMAQAVINGKRSTQGLDIQRTVLGFIPEFRILDEIVLKSDEASETRLHTASMLAGNLAAFLLLLRKMPHEQDHITHFIRNFVNGEGLQIPGRGRDSVMALIMALKGSPWRSPDDQYRAMERTLNAVLTWKPGVADRTEQGVNPRNAINWAARRRHDLIKKRKYENRFMKEQFEETEAVEGTEETDPPHQEEAIDIFGDEPVAVEAVAEVEPVATRKRGRPAKPRAKSGQAALDV